MVLIGDIAKVPAIVDYVVHTIWLLDTNRRLTMELLMIRKKGRVYKT